MATSHLHQAAVVLRSLPDPQAARLLKELSPRQAAAISGEIARLDRPGGDEQEIAIREFTAAARKKGAVPVCAQHAPGRSGIRGLSPFSQAGEGEVENGRQTPENDPSLGHAPASFAFLDCLDAENILALLADEHPQTAALVLFHLPSHLAVAVIDLLEPQKRAAIVRRIAIMVLPGPEIVGELADAIRRRAEKGRGEREETGWSRVVKILNTMRPAAERQLLGRLAGTDPDLLHDIRSAMFGPDVAALCQPAGA